MFREGRTAMTRLPTALFLVPGLLAAGCIPLGTVGYQHMAGSGWPGALGDKPVVGVTVPIPVFSPRTTGVPPAPPPPPGVPAASSPAVSPISAFGVGTPYGPSPVYMAESWILDLSIFYTDAEEGAESIRSREYALGVGQGVYARHGGPSGMGDHLMWGWSAGLSFLDGEYTNSFLGLRDRDSTVGPYVSLGFYNLAWGGILLHGSLAPALELGGEDRDVAAVSVAYWWGVIPSVGAWVLLGHGIR